MQHKAIVKSIREDLSELAGLYRVKDKYIKIVRKYLTEGIFSLSSDDVCNAGRSFIKASISVKMLLLERSLISLRRYEKEYRGYAHVVKPLIKEFDEIHDTIEKSSELLASLRLMPDSEKESKYVMIKDTTSKCVRCCRNVGMNHKVWLASVKTTKAVPKRTWGIAIFSGIVIPAIWKIIDCRHEIWEWITTIVSAIPK